MVDIIPSGITSTATLSNKGDAYGTIETAGDTDIYRVTLSAGNYHINLGGDPVFGSALSDTVVRVYNSAGQLLAVDDDNGAGSSSYIDFTASASGTYFIAVNGFSSNTGDYALWVKENGELHAPFSFRDGTLEPGQSLTGRADVNNEVDRYDVYLEAGVTYTFTTEGQPGVDGPNSDPITPLEGKRFWLSPGASGPLSGSSGTITWTKTPTESGMYFVDILGRDDTDHGYFTVSMTSTAPLVRGHRPSGADRTITIQEDVARTFTFADFPVSDDDWDGLSAIIITSLPSVGALYFGGSLAQVGQKVQTGELPQLRWVPPANAHGSGLASFSFVVVDTGVHAGIDPTPNTITFNVAAVNDPTIITSGGGQPAAAFELNENRAVVTTVQASDADNTPNYGLSGPDASLFDINSATGVLTFRAPPDFETGGDNVYDITVLATDGLSTDTQAVQVLVRNVAGNTIAGTKGNNTVDATHAIDSKASTSEEDYIDGKKGNDKLSGLAGNDTILGGAGKDTLTGGAGFDRLDGGKDADRFVFSAKFNVAGVDTIVKFEHDKDKLALDSKVFKALGSSLTADEFYAKAGATKAKDKSDHIIYDKSTGNLYYDADAKGGTGAILFATLSNKPTLDHGDFMIV